MEIMRSIKEISDTIAKCLNEQVDKDNPDELTGKLMELCSLQASASHCYALAEQVYNHKIAALLTDPRHAKMTATDKKMLFAGLAKEEIFYVTLSERHIKNLSYSIEAIRSALSWKKSELENAKYQNT